jgi:hypothetical protein
VDNNVAVLVLKDVLVDAHSREAEDVLGLKEGE